MYRSVLLVEICGNKRFKISLSKMFDKKGKILIGINEIGISSGLSCFAKLIILERKLIFFIRLENMKF